MSSSRDRIRSPASLRLRASATLVAALTALGPGAVALAAPARTSVVAIPYATLPGAAGDFSARVYAAIVSELKQRGELKLVDAQAGGESGSTAEKAKGEAEKTRAAASQLIAKAAEQSKKNKSRLAAQTLERAAAQLSSQPFSLDEAGGKLLSDALLQLAINRAMAGDGEGSDAALAELIVRAPDRKLAASDYPPAFLRAFEVARQRTLTNPRASIRVFAPAGATARVLLDGRPLGNAPLLMTDALPGDHAVRVESGDQAWAESIKLEAGAELSLLPRFGAGGSAADELAGALAQGSIDRATAAKAVRVAKAAGAQAALVGTVSHEGDGYSVRSALVLVRGEKVVQLAPLTLDAEMLGASLEVLRLADDLVAKIASPPAGAALPLAMGGAAAESAAMPSVAAAPPAPETALSLPAASDLALAAGTGSKPGELAFPEASETAPAAAPAPVIAPPATAPPSAAAAPAPAASAATNQAAPAAAAPSAPVDQSGTAAAAAAFTAAAAGSASNGSAPATGSSAAATESAPGRMVVVPSQAPSGAPAADANAKVPLAAPAPAPVASSANTPPAAPAPIPPTAPAAPGPAPATPPAQPKAAPLAGSLDTAVAGLGSASATAPGAASPTPATSADGAAPAGSAPPSSPSPTAQATSEGRRVLVPGAAPSTSTTAAPATGATSPEANTASTGADAALTTASPRHPVEPAAPSRDLFVPRRPTPHDEDDQPVAVVVPPNSAQPAPPAATRMEAREANEIATVHEQPQKNHAVLWIVGGAVLLGAAAACGIVLYAEGRTATSSNVTLSWSH